jgi:hypothetical protein
MGSLACFLACQDSAVATFADEDFVGLLEFPGGAQFGAQDIDFKMIGCPMNGF